MSYFNNDYDYYEHQERRRGRGILAFAAIALICVVVGVLLVMYISDDDTSLAQASFDPSATMSTQLPTSPGQTGDTPSQTGYPGQQDDLTGGRSVAQILAGDDNPVVRIAEEVSDSIVGISNKAFWYSRRDGSRELVEQSTGSGIILSADGYVVTNYHVIESAEAVSVVLFGGKEVEAEIIGYDERTDLAVLKITEAVDGLVPAVLGESANVKVGQLAIAIGNPLGLELAGTTTLGCVSAVDRVLTLSDGRTVTLIQTDAAISSGNSGGALLNIKGEVIGITTLKASSTSTSSASIEGLGFAIPIDVAKPIIQEIIETGAVTRPGLGISGMNYTAAYVAQYGGIVGLYVGDTQEGSGAREAGLQEGDIITHLNGERMYTFEEMKQALTAHRVGDYVDITYYREGSETTVKVRLVGITS